MRRAYLYLAFGYLCVGVNLVINDVGILLPTVLGYILISLGLFRLEGLTRLAALGGHLAIPLAILSIPQLLWFIKSFASWKTFDARTGWPGIVLRQVLMVITAIVVWRTAPERHRDRVQIAIPAFFVVAILAFVGWLLLYSDDNTRKVASFFVYESPALYLAALTGLMGRSMHDGQRRRSARTS